MKFINIIHLIHIFLIGGLFLYVGLIKNNIKNWMFPVLFYLGIFLILYQSYKLYKSNGLYNWVYYFHIIIIAPLLILIGLYKEKSPQYYFDFIFMLAFAVIGYHGYYLYLDT